MLKLVDQPGGKVWAAEAPNWAAIGDKETLLIGISEDAISAKAGRGQRWQLGQMYGVVGPGLIFAQHVFGGLKRGMYVRNNTEADQNKLAVTWAAKKDARLDGEQYDPYINEVPAPVGAVFVVYISVNEMLNEYTDVYGWAEHWAWLACDPDTAGAPIDWQTRYDKKLWSKP